VADLDASGNPLRSYTWGQGIDDLLAITVYTSEATNSYYAVKDHLGSVQALVDASGAVVQSYTYDAWGNITSSFNILPSSFSCRYLWQGREYSAATGLYNFRARWYEPRLGRWLSDDPIGISGGLNQYEFCGNNPVNYVDPDGLRVEIHSRWVKGLEGLASHTYITITKPNGPVHTWGSYSDNGCNVVRYNDPSDVGTLRTSTITEPPPPGMTQSEWDEAVNLEGIIRKYNVRQKYWPLGGGRDGKYGNCNNTTRGILEGAGGGVPKGYDPPGLNPGF
jgi:RHS repeat-associated protein